MKQQNDAKSNKLKIVRNSYFLIGKNNFGPEEERKTQPSATCIDYHVGQFLTGTFHFPHVSWQKREKKTEHLGERLHVV